MGRLIDCEKGIFSVLAFFPVVAISTNLSTDNNYAKQIKKSDKKNIIRS